jgi:hypothetical protein
MGRQKIAGGIAPSDPVAELRAHARLLKTKKSISLNLFQSFSIFFNLPFW